MYSITAFRTLPIFSTVYLPDANRWENQVDRVEQRFSPEMNLVCEIDERRFTARITATMKYFYF